MKKLVISGKLGEELMAAYKYVGELPNMEPAGIMCATRELAEVRKQSPPPPLLHTPTPNEGVHSLGSAEAGEVEIQK